MNQKSPIIVGWSVLFLMFLCGNALAHKVTVFAWVEGDTVLGETKFSGGKRAKGAEVIVRDIQGREILRTRTDENGEFSFPIPKKCAMRIELIAGMGHKGEWTIPIEDVDAVAARDIAAAEKTQDGATQTPGDAPQTEKFRTDGSRAEKSNTDSASAPQLNKTELEALIEKTVERTMEKALNKKITPLVKMLADLEQKAPSFSEVAGGIGYIFGLAGVALYFKSRRKKNG